MRIRTRSLIKLALVALGGCALAIVLSAHGAHRAEAAPLDKVTAPVTQAAEPVVHRAEPVTQAAKPVVEPVVRAVAPVAEPVTSVVRPVVDPVHRAAQPVLDPVAPIVQPILPDIPLPPFVPSTPLTPPPSSRAPAPSPVVQVASRPVVSAVGLLRRPLAPVIERLAGLDDPHLPVWPQPGHLSLPRQLPASSPALPTTDIPLPGGHSVPGSLAVLVAAAAAATLCARRLRDASAVRRSLLYASSIERPG